MGWEPGNRLPPVPPVAETRLWVMVKAARSATAAVRPHPLGPELVVRIAGEILWSRVIRPQDGVTVEGEAEFARQGFVERGWETAE